MFDCPELGSLPFVPEGKLGGCGGARDRTRRATNERRASGVAVAAAAWVQVARREWFRVYTPEEE